MAQALLRHSKILIECGPQSTTHHIHRRFLILDSVSQAQRHAHSISKSNASDYYGNGRAIQSLKELLASKKLNDHHNHNRDVVDQALKVYNGTDPLLRDALLINSFLKICLHFKHPKMGLVVMEDVKRIIPLSNTRRRVSYPSLLKCCISSNDFHRGEEIHQLLSSKLKEGDDIFTETTLITFYGHFGDIESADKIFSKIAKDRKNSVTIAAMMKALITNNLNEDALSIYGSFPELQDDVVHLLALKACTKSDDFQKGEAMIKSIMKCIKKLDIELLNTMIDFYGHFGEIQSAEDIFNQIPATKTKIESLNAMMTVYVDNDHHQEALSLFDTAASCHSKMDKMDDVTRILAIKACTKSKNWNRGQEIHSMMKCSKMKMHRNINIQLVNTLIDFYGSSGERDHLEIAQNMFNAVDDRKRSCSTLNVMMKALMNHKEGAKALALYETHDEEQKDDISHLLALKSCITTGDMEKGRDIIESKMKQHHIAWKTTTMEFYGKTNDLETAERIFRSIADGRRDMDIVTISAMMGIYIQNGFANKALELYEECLVRKDDISHVLAVKACIECGAFAKEREIHSAIYNESSAQSVELENTLIDLYGTFGDYKTSLRIFEQIPDHEKTIESVNAMMDAFCSSAMNQECIELFDCIESEYHLTPTMITYAVALKACTQGTMLHFGTEIEQQLEGWMRTEASIQVHLINLYGKCGDLGKCEEIFDGVRKREKDKYLGEIRVWNAMIKAFGRNGDPQKGKAFLDEMLRETALVPDNQIWKALITAHGHSGDAKGAKEMWMKEIPKQFKYDNAVITALVDCLSRKGLIRDAYQLVVEYGKQDHHVAFDRDHLEREENKAMWIALLSGCKSFGHKDIAQIAFTELETRYGTAASPPQLSSFTD